MFLIFQDNFIIDDFLLSDVITSNCKFITDSDCHIMPFNFDVLFHLKKLNINDLLNLDNKRLNFWIEFRQYLNLSLNNKEITIYKNFLEIYKENNNKYDEKLLYLSAKYNMHELYYFLDNNNLNSCYVLSCLNAIIGKSINIIKYIHNKYKNNKIWIKNIKGLIYKNDLYQIDENNKYENDDWSILYYGNISKNTQINNDIKNFLLKINCPFNENMSFRQ